MCVVGASFLVDERFTRSLQNNVRHAQCTPSQCFTVFFSDLQRFTASWAPACVPSNGGMLSLPDGGALAGRGT
jgi:hypothetical protein